MYEDLVRESRESAEWAENSPDFVVPTIVLYTMRKAADAIEELTAMAESYKRSMEAWAEVARAQPHWIPVTEAPALKVGDEGYLGYLVYANGYYHVADYVADYAIGRLDNEPSFHVDGEYEPDITHWMPLPKPPKEEA